MSCPPPGRTRRRRVAVATVVAIIASLAAAAVLSGAQAVSRNGSGRVTLKLGSDSGIRVVRGAGGRIVVEFTGSQPRRVRRLVGKAIAVRCFRFGAAGLGPSELKISTATAPLRSLSKPVRTEITGRYDACTVLDAGLSQPLAHVPITQTGADRIDEDATLTRIIVAASIAGAAADAAHDSTYPPSDKLADAMPDPTVPLERQDDSPPRGQIGVFSDGARHLEVVALTQSNRRIFLDFNTDVVSTNAFRALGEVQSGRAP